MGLQKETCEPLLLSTAQRDQQKRPALTSLGLERA